MKNTNNIGLIGFGSFGELIIQHLGAKYNFLVNTRSKPTKKVEKASFVSLSQATSQSIIILAIPLSAYKKTLIAISKNAPKKAIVIDVCSVKVLPFKLARRFLRADIEFIGTHPLFGPQSAAKSLNGQTIVVCNQKDTLTLEKFNILLIGLGLKVVQMSADEHDKQMAEVHALTFFVARGLMKTGLHKNTLLTPSFQKMLDLAELETHHSESLFQIIEGGNPYARSTRHKFIKNLKALNKKIKSV